MPASPLSTEAMIGDTRAESAIVLTEQHGSPFGMPNEMLDLLGQPMLQRVIERLVRAGITHIHVVLGSTPLSIKKLLGDGARWGCKITYHLGHAADRLDHIARRIDLAPEALHVLVDAALMPRGEDTPGPFDLSNRTAPQAAVWQGASGLHWAGWALLEGQWMRSQPIALEFDALQAAILESQAVRKPLKHAPLSSATLADVLHSNRALLADRCIDNHACILMGRGCQIHPSAQLTPPLYLGDQVKIGAEAQVGPGVILGHGALIERDARIKNAVVLPETYIGEGLEVADSIAGGNMLANIRLDTTVGITDANLLATLPGKDRVRLRTPRRERLAAQALRILLAPLQGLIYLLGINNPVTESQPLRMSVAMPRPGQDKAVEVTARMSNPRKSWRNNRALDWAHHFRHAFYPGLSEVSRGRLSLVGPSPRSLAEIRLLPEDWQALYESNRCGLINDTLFHGSEGLSPEMQYASDAMASLKQGQLVPALKEVWRYVGQVARNLGAKSGAEMAESRENVTK